MFALPLGERAELRPLEPWQAEEFHAHMNRAREHIAPWVGASFVSHDLEGARRVLQSYAERRVQDNGGIYGIWYDGTLVGGCMYVSFSVKSGVTEVGCWLEPGAEGRGLITRAVAHLIDHAFRVRGLSRIEWQTNADNARSIAVARRLGMSRDGVMRQAIAGSPRADLEVWSLLAEEWRAPSTVDMDEIDALTARFYQAFAVGRVDSLEEVFVPQGLIVKAGPGQELYDVKEFIAPRRALLESGELVDFAEGEVWSRTEIFGAAAARFGRYSKSGVLRGERFEGAGTKAMHFVRTPAGWRMAALTWDDDPQR